MDKYIAVDSSNNPTVAITRQWLKPLPHSSSQLKLTGIRISVHFNGLELLDRELILCRVMNYICASMR